MTVEDEVPRDPADWTEEDMLSLAIREIVTVDRLITEQEAGLIFWGGNTLKALEAGRVINRLKGDSVFALSPGDVFISVTALLVYCLGQKGRAGIGAVVKRLRELMEKGVHVEVLDAP